MGLASDTTKKRGIFYGWWVVLATSVVTLYGAGTFFYGFTAFFNPIIEEFGWSRAVTSLAFSIQRFEGGVAGPIVGFLVDRIGPRKLMLFGSTVAGLGFVYFSFVDSLFSFFMAFIFISIGFSACLGSVGMAAVANWFIRRRSMALGLMMAGAGASGVIVPILVWLIASFGWRTALVICGAGMLVIGIPFSALVRHRPEQYGYLPDGDTVPSADPRDGREGLVDGEGVRFGEVDYSVRESLRTRAFWLLTLGLSFSQIATSSVVLHEIPYLTSVGISRGAASLVVTFMTIISIVGRIGFGWLGDKFEKRYVLAGAYSMQAVGVLAFALISETWHLVPFLLVFGLSYGGAIPLRPAIQGEYFGRTSFGSIQGLIAFATTAGGVIGPWLAGWIFDVQGSYRLAWILFSVTTLAGVPAFLVARRPVKSALPVQAPAEARQG